ncbi:MAG TPA: PHB depolymerase family esterase [bacterium]|nr:PHB depolymerase family esterase [bacterium]
MRPITAVLVLTVAAVQAPSGAAAAPSTLAGTVQVGGLQRSYLVHVPGSFPGGRPAGLVFVLHGGGGNGKQIERHTGFSALADREGFIAVYPDAVDRNWNDGRAAPGITAQQQNVDDVGFFAALITGLTREFAVDPRRVYVTGASNGAFMSQRLAAELSERIAAIAPVIGGMAPQVRDRFAPKVPVSVLLMNGTDDPLVPYRGGAVARTRGQTIGVAEIVRLWRTHNRCPEGPETVLLADADPTDGTRVRRTAYARCANRTAVTLYTIEGGGHTWPGGVQYLPRAVIGRTNRDIEATPVIWQFFAGHPRP